MSIYGKHEQMEIHKVRIREYWFSNGELQQWEQRCRSDSSSICEQRVLFPIKVYAKTILSCLLKIHNMGGRSKKMGGHCKEIDGHSKQLNGISKSLSFLCGQPRLLLC